MKDEDKTKEQLLKDLTELKKRLTELEKMEERHKKMQKEWWRDQNVYKILIDSIPQKIFVKDKNLNFVAANKKFAADLKIEPEEIVGKTVYDYWPKELADKYFKDSKHVLETGKTEDIEEEYILDGKQVFVQTIKTPVKDEQGNNIGVLGIFWDITEKKRLEEDLEKAVVLRTSVLEAINEIFRERIKCKNEEELGEKCLGIAEKLTGSKFGFLGEINSAGLFDTIAISNPGWDECKFPDEEARKVIKNMPISGLDRNTMKEGKSRLVNDPYKHPDSKGVPKGHPPIENFLGVPFKHEGRVIGMIGLANKKKGYNKFDKEAVEKIALAIVEALRSKRAEVKIAMQAKEIMEVSTPIMQIWEGVVVAPLIGTLDSQRTQQFMEQLLERIVETNSPVALIDITGVPVIDTQTAQHLIETISSVKLLGSQSILTGVRPAIAQTLVHLGIDLTDVITRPSLVSGLKEALGIIGKSVVSVNNKNNE